MAYESAGQAQLAQSAARPTPELGRLKAAAEYVAVIANKIENFVARFHGEQAGNPDTSTPVSDTYRNDLNSLFDQINRLETAVAALDTIG